jgi:hypothetical protein
MILCKPPAVTPRLLFCHPERSEGSLGTGVPREDPVGGCHPEATFSSPRGVSGGVSNSQRRKVSRYARNEKISRRCLATLGTTGEECHPEATFYVIPNDARDAVPSASEGCLAIARQDKRGCSAGQKMGARQDKGGLSP